MPLCAEVTQHSQTDMNYRAFPATLRVQESFQFKNTFLLETVEIIRGYMKTKAQPEAIPYNLQIICSCSTFQLVTKNAEALCSTSSYFSREVKCPKPESSPHNAEPAQWSVSRERQQSW